MSDHLLYLDDIEVEVGGKGIERIGKIAEYATMLLRQMKVPASHMFSKPQLASNHESKLNSPEPPTNFEIVVVAGIAF